LISQNFKDWSCSFSGCDGGNLEADTWLCGIEWGGGSYDNGVYYKDHLPKEIKKGKVVIEISSFNWKDSVTYTYGRSFAKLFAAIRGEDINSYKDLAINKWDGSELFKLNLYPIAFDSTDGNLWHEYKLDEITGFNEKNLFQTWCFVNRFPFFSELRAVKKPKLIICTGISYLRDFFICFGGNQANSSLIEYGEINPLSENNESKVRRYYWVKIDENTTLIVIPFFSGIYGLNSNDLLQEMGNRIRCLSI
jgi:hypothetical protein